MIINKLIRRLMISLNEMVLCNYTMLKYTLNKTVISAKNAIVDKIVNFESIKSIY